MGRAGGEGAAGARESVARPRPFSRADVSPDAPPRFNCPFPTVSPNRLGACNQPLRRRQTCAFSRPPVPARSSEQGRRGSARFPAIPHGALALSSELFQRCGRDAAGAIIFTVPQTDPQRSRHGRLPGVLQGKVAGTR